MVKKILFLVALLLVPGQVLAYNLPSYRELCKNLVDLSGWKAEECTGLNATNPMGEIASATRTYTRDKQELNVQLVLGAAAMAAAGPLAYQRSFEMDSPEEFIRITTIDGFRVGIQYNKKTHSGSVGVFLTEPPKTMDPASISQMAILVVGYQNMDWKEALSWAQKFDWKSLKAAIGHK